MNTFRAWVLQQEVTAASSGSTGPRLTRRCRSRLSRFKVIAVLAETRVRGTAAQVLDWYQSGYATEVDQGTLNGVSYNENVPYLQYVKDVVSRYANNPTIAAWEL